MGPWMAKWLAKGFMLLLFGIPVFVWMKWRQRIAENDRAWDDSAFALKQQHTPPPKPPVHVGSGVE
jgi:hypothetical protein